jgi:hypothetical protein
MAVARKNKRKASTGQLVSFVPGSYLDRTSRPVYAVAYLLVFIVIYELGTLMISPDVLNESISHARVRVVSFIWLRDLLEYVGFSPRFIWIATPLAVVCILLTLQITSGSAWRIYIRDFGPMTVECILLAVPLIVLSLVLNRSADGAAMQGTDPPAQVRVLACAASPDQPQTADGLLALSASGHTDARHGFIVNVVTGIGAGIYEEFIFRLLMIILLMILFQDLLGIPKPAAITFSVLISAALFSLHHHIFFVNGALQKGDPFSTARFMFRFLAGVYFAGLFAVRGFGAAAGTHAWYDIIAATLNAFVYTPGQ